MSLPLKINITYPDQRLNENRARQRAMWARSYHDRVPLWLGVHTRYVLWQRGVSYTEYWKTPRDHLIHQLENFRWIVENVDDDRWGADEILLVPDFENIPNSAAMGCAIGWMDDEPPRAFPCITTPQQMVDFVAPSPRDGLWGKMLEWCAEMNRLLASGMVSVTRNNTPLPVHVTMGAYSLGPFSVAVDMVGTVFYEWLLTYPQACRSLLSKITAALIAMESYCRRLDSRRVGGYNLAEDSAQIISPNLFEEFCVPFAWRLYDTFPGERTMHMCGRSNHLHRSLLEDVRVTYFSGFGSVVRPEEIALTLGGRMLLRGNIDCVLLKDGTSEQVRAAARHCLQTLAPLGGYVVCDGYNIAPGTPLENLWAIKDEVAAYGSPTQESRS
ncbi:MAG: uroporphyrinogen decarboxylase family protein [Chloroflexi bacterium]|nr:uroporphyrinogen decarboxylase family protein [Chloroflexota bacterium]